MRLRVKIVPVDQPNADGEWVTRKVSMDKPVFGDLQAPKGMVIVAYRRPRRYGRRTRTNYGFKGVTITGRFASSRPNMQTIPMRTEEVAVIKNVRLSEVRTGDPGKFLGMMRMLFGGE